MPKIEIKRGHAQMVKHQDALEESNKDMQDIQS